MGIRVKKRKNRMDHPVRGEKEVIQALEVLGCRPVVSRFPRGTKTARSSSTELGVGLERIVKSIVLDTGDGPAIALLPGDRRVDTKKAAGILGAKKARLADPESVLEWTGFPVGAVPPLGHRKRIPVLMDEKIPSDGFIYPAAGKTNNAFRTTFQELREVTEATVCGISKEEGTGRTVQSPESRVQRKKGSGVCDQD